MTLKSKLDHANKRCEKLEKEIRGDKDEPKKEDDGKLLSLEIPIGLRRSLERTPCNHNGAMIKV